MDTQDWLAVFTGLLVLTAIIYTIGTFLLWKTTRAAMRLNILLSMRQAYGVQAKEFTELLETALPKEAHGLIEKFMTMPSQHNTNTLKKRGRIRRMIKTHLRRWWILNRLYHFSRHHHGMEAPKDDFIQWMTGQDISPDSPDESHKQGEVMRLPVVEGRIAFEGRQAP